jgi:hypothetical protein
MKDAEMGPFDLERARRDTLGAAKVAHLNNTGAALPPAQVTEPMVAHRRVVLDVRVVE